MNSQTFCRAVIAFLVLIPIGVSAQQDTTDALIKRMEIQVKLSPTDYKAFAGLGAAYLQKGRETGDASDFELAKKTLAKSLDLVSNDPAAAYAMTQMAVVCMSEHRFGDAYAWAQKAIAQGSGDPSPWAIAGDALADMGRYQEAEAAYSRLTNSYGSEDEQLGLAYQRDSRMSYLKLVAGDSTTAIQLMQAAIRTAAEIHAPAENVAWSDYQLGEEYFQTGDLDRAEAAYRASLHEYSGYYRALAGLAKIEAAKRNYREAESLYEGAIAAVPYPEYAAALGDIYVASHETAKAQKEFKLVEFIGHLSEINREIHNRDLALFYADHDIRLSEAVALARKELEVRRDVYTWDVLAWTLYKNGETSEAAPAMSHALEQGTKDPQLLFHAGMIYGRLRDVTKARQFLTEALATNPNFHPLHADMARKTLAELANEKEPQVIQEANNAK